MLLNIRKFKFLKNPDENVFLKGDRALSKLIIPF